jgi:2'-5' RNA ligase
MATPTKLSLTSRETALCIIPPRTQWSKVDQLRSHYDRAYGKWPPHINLVYPFVQVDALPRAAEAVQSAAAAAAAAAQPGQKHFDVCLDSAGVFQHKQDNTIYIYDNDDSQLSNLRAAVLLALGQQDAGGNRMHMTIGQSEDSKSTL